MVKYDPGCEVGNCQKLERNLEKVALEPNQDCADGWESNIRWCCADFVEMDQLV